LAKKHGKHGILAKSQHLTKITVSVISVIFYCPYILVIKDEYNDTASPSTTIIKNN